MNCIAEIVLIVAAFAGGDRAGIFFAALAAVESGGEPAAYNARERAAGLYQIRPIYLDDVNRMLKACDANEARPGTRKRYFLRDRLDPAAAREIVTIYISHYCTAARLGRPVTILDAARIHNGGPDGWRKETTANYGARFIRQLEKLQRGKETYD